ncbi:hypothetical protein ACOZ38_18490 [Sphaerisporangium viridialbum]|uniref:hypothetical protein n=1 Tax=Sphaerisporangium viridialbum TaxID=46189 RepID=UPI003C726D6D
MDDAHPEIYADVAMWGSRSTAHYANRDYGSAHTASCTASPCAETGPSAPLGDAGTLRRRGRFPLVTAAEGPGARIRPVWPPVGGGGNVILVTGATGRVGFRLLERLADALAEARAAFVGRPPNISAPPS